MVVLVIIIFLNLFVGSFTGQLRVGGLFEEEDENAKLAFQLAVKIVNKNNNNPYYNLIPISSRAYHFDTLFTTRTVCSMFQDGIVGLIGPTSPYTSPHVKSLCDLKDIPLIETHWDTLRKNDCLVNMYPYPPELARSFVEIVKAWKWKSFTILYEDDDSLYRVSELLRMYNNTQYTVTLRQLFDINDDYRQILLEIKRSGEKYMVIDCSIELLEEVLQQAQQIGMMTEQYNYIIMNLDMSTLDLFPYQYGGSNITGVRLVNPIKPKVRNVAQRLQKLRLDNGLPPEAFEHLAAWKLKTQTALIVDAVHLLHETLKELRISSRLDVEPIYCNTTDSWEKGSSIINYMKAKTLEGITGTIKFDTETGVRNDFTIELVELSPGGLIEIGSWNSKDGLNITRVYTEDDNNILFSDDNPLRGKMFIIITALTPPYGMLKNISSALAGNDQYEGYAIDLIEELSKMLDFNYTFVIQEDGANGNYNVTTKTWDGMIGEVIKGRADFAITDLTISSEREKYVDFTMPFMNLGISILYRKPEPAAPSLFTFASPFSVEVWILLAVAYFFVSISIFIMGRLSPSEWTNPYPCVEEPEFLINQFSIRNSLWFTVGSLMQQGSDFAPLGISTRMAAGVWWFFTLILVSSYTANLAAFLTIEELVTPFKDVEELTAQPDIKYGAKTKGATYNFFQNSNYSVYPQIRDYMNSHPEYMTAGNEKGVERVETENYAFFMESTTIEYVTERHCNLTQVGGALDEKGYGIAMQKQSKYRHVLTEAILALQESGKLEELKRKWWKEKRGGGTCEKRQPVATPLDLQNLGGVFFVLGVGTVFGIFGTFIEVGWHTYRKSHKKQLSFKKEVRKELKFFIKFKEMARDIQRQNSIPTGATSDDTICRKD